MNSFNLDHLRSMIKQLLLAAVALSTVQLQSQSKKPAETPRVSSTFSQVVSGLSFRSIGPAVTSGRIVDLCVNPSNTSQWYIAAGSGGVWKTDNAGTTFYPIFDGQGSFSIGCITMDPSNHNTIWVGSGENNNQRSVAYGDGVYKSEDGGKTWKNVGLKLSEHIGMIAVDPNNSQVVYVAAYGPLWSAGGDRGIYKTTDGGKTWTRILHVSDNTGFNEIHIDRARPNILYATAHQRRRHEWTYLGGGPESAIYKSIDNGSTWTKLENGLPKGDIGRIGIAIPPSNTDIVYALIEAEEGNGGLYKSTDRGASWTKQSGHTTAGNYYNEIFADPVNPDKIYSMNNWAVVSSDGGKTFKGIGERSKHVDNHVIWVDPKNTSHYLMGCDGGLYETWDEAATWNYKANLSITQFYRVTTDNALPFYNIYGGTQDNNTLGGPSRTISASGIHNYDWFVTVGGDGFKTVVDTKNPDIVYSQWQYGGLVRFNRKTGEALDIKPQEMQGEPAYRYNWDAPIVLSNFDNKTLYFAAQKVFKSKDMGNTWEVISPDLSRGIDRNTLSVMGKVWSVDAVAKNQSTSIYGNITALSESPKNPMLLYAGTDDGLIHVTQDGGKTWSKTSTIPGVPNQALIQNIYASKHDEQVVYAVVNNHRNGDFKPYLVKSVDKGKTWSLLNGNLPERGSLQCLAEDHKNKNLLFCGTDFGVFTTIDAGKTWEKMGSLPTICVKEIAIQERENDLVLATFGRGFYVLDDYSPLQNYDIVSPALVTQAAIIFPVKDGLVYMQSTPLGHKGKSFQGESFFTAENPPVGAVISYYIKDDYKTIKSLRKAREEKQVNDYYPNRDSLRLEDNEPETYILAVIKDAEGNIIRQFKRAAVKGHQRLVWNGRMERTSPITFYTPDPSNPYEGEDQGPMALPGDYTIELQLVKNYRISLLTGPVGFKIKTLHPMKSDIKFNKELADFRRVVLGVDAYCNEIKNRLSFVKQGINQINQQDLLRQIGLIEEQIKKYNLVMHGDGSMASREFETLPGLIGSLEGIVGNLWATTEMPTTTYTSRLKEIKANFKSVYQQVQDIDTLMKSLELQLDKNKFPYTPGRLPDWNE